eukprot:2657599-Amphidinium_carterae.1
MSELARYRIGLTVNSVLNWKVAQTGRWSEGCFSSGISEPGFNWCGLSTVRSCNIDSCHQCHDNTNSGYIMSYKLHVKARGP